MTKPKKLITINGKRQLVDYDYKPRSTYNRDYNESRNRNNPEYVKFYHSREWRETRKLVLSRDYNTCVRCGAPATMVDHIVTSKQSWEDRLNTDNLESLCKDCHSIKTRREWVKEHKGAKRSMQIKIVAGYPGAGKSTYVQKHRTDHDLIYDYDTLMQSLTGQPLHTMNWDAHEYVELIHDMILRKIRSEQTFNNIWIIETIHDKRLDSLLVGMNVDRLMIATPRATCIDRLYQGGRGGMPSLLEQIDKIDQAIEANEFKDFKKIKN